jgi:hypothetical protein
MLLRRQFGCCHYSAVISAWVEEGANISAKVRD